MDKCHRCQGTRYLVEGDGPTVCHMCIDMLTGIASDPYRADHRIVTALLERHGDVLHLERFPIPGGDTELRWTWAS